MKNHLRTLLATLALAATCCLHLAAQTAQKHPTDLRTSRDSQMPYQVYFYERSIPYYQYMGNHERVIDCCDSVIVNAPKYKLTNTWPYQLRGETLGQMGRWQEAYQNSVTWMAVKDSLANVSSQAKLMELQTQYDVDRLQYQTQVSRQRLLPLRNPAPHHHRPSVRPLRIRLPQPFPHPLQTAIQHDTRRI